MIRASRVCVVLCGCVVALLVSEQSARAGAVPIIFDTDMHGDCDDAGALAMLHALATDGEAEILACMVSTNSFYSPGCVDAINTYYGRPDIPIGAYKGTYYTNTGGYPATIATSFPNDVINQDNVPEAVTLYRQILSAQPDNSVTIVTVGFLTNLELLLLSAADGYGPDGVTLVDQKVERYVAMAGAFPSGGEYNLNWDGIGPTSKYVIDNWPTPIIFSGFEIGDSIGTGAALINTPVDNPVREAYKLYLGSYGTNRSSWDQTAVLCAVKGISPYWTSVSTGYCHVYTAGNNEWMAAPDGDHEYLVGAWTDAAIGDVIEGYMVEPPDPTRPDASFTASVSVYAVTVDASASTDDGSIVSYQWDFGDGGTASGLTAAHTYTSDGSYQITLTVTDDTAKTDTANQAVTVGAALVAGHWPLDETSGLTAQDVAGGKDGTLGNFAAGDAHWVTGAADGGLSLDGVDDMVTVDATAALAVESLTLAAWVYVPGSLPSGWRTVIEHDRSGDNWYGLWLSANGPVFHFRWANGASPVGCADFTTTVLPDTWYHVAGTLDAATGTATFYLDGAVDRTLTGCSAGTPGTAALRIGANLTGSEPLAAVIDDVRVYSRALSLAEIQAIESGDTDGDGMLDGDEIGAGYNLHDGDQDDNGTADGLDDWDDDGTDNQTEIASSQYPGDVPATTGGSPSTSTGGSGPSCAASALGASGAPTCAAAMACLVALAALRRRRRLFSA